MRGAREAREAKVDRGTKEGRDISPLHRSHHQPNYQQSHYSNLRKEEQDEGRAMAKRRRDETSERSAWRKQEARLDYDQSNRSRGRSVHRVHHSSQRGRISESRQAEGDRIRGKERRDRVLEIDDDQEQPPRRSLTYAEAAKGAARTTPSDRFSSRKLSPAGTTRVTRLDDEGEWLLVRSHKSIKAEKRLNRDESASAGSGQQCHKCAQWGHTITHCTNDWFCYVYRRSGHISRECSSYRRAPTTAPTTPKAASPTNTHSSKTQESFAGGRSMIKVLITPTPLMAELERRFRMCCIIKVQSGNPVADDIEGWLYANITPSATLQWRVQRLHSSVFFVHCHDEDRLNEVLGKRGMGSDDYYVTFTQWSRQYGALKPNEMSSIWIRLFNFPFHCWLRSGFQNLVRAFGFLQEIDKSTITQERREFARIRIGCDNFSDIPSMVQAEFEGEFFDFKVIVEKKKNVSFAKISAREEDELSDDRKKGTELRWSKVEDEGGPSNPPDQDLGRSSKHKEQDTLRITDEYGSNLKVGIQKTVREAGFKDAALTKTAYQRRDRTLGQGVHIVGAEGTATIARKPEILKNSSIVDNDARDRVSREVPGFALLSKEELQDSIKKAIEELERRGGFGGINQEPHLQGSDGKEKSDQGSILGLGKTSMGLICRDFPKPISNLGLPSGEELGPREINGHGINLVDEAAGNCIDEEEGIGENLFRENEAREEENGMVEVDSEEFLEHDAHVVDTEPIGDMIGALDGLQSGGSTYDSEHEKWAKQVRELAGGGARENESVGGNRSIIEVQRKSKRQLDKWGSSGPSEEDLIRAAAKTREPTSACQVTDRAGIQLHHAEVQPLSRIRMHLASFAVDGSASIKASPSLLGMQGQDIEWIKVEIQNSKPSTDDWVGVFSPAKFNASTCPTEPGNTREQIPLICSSPIKYQFAKYANSGKGSMRFQLINQRSDFSFALFTGGLETPKVIAVSDAMSFANPKAPVYPRLSQGKEWNEMTVTWTSGYDIDEALPFVEWGPKNGPQTRSAAGTLTFSRNDMCGSPARTFGWRDPGYIHTSFLKDLWPNAVYTYKIGHQLFDGKYVWSKQYSFRASPYPGQNSLQRVIIFGDMGKAERDGSNEFSNYQPGSLNTTDQLVKDLNNYDIVFHIGDMSYANGYISQWDQFTSQIEPIASAVPYMVASGNHERDWPGTGSFYDTNDSGGECGVVAETMFYVPAENRANFWYATDYGMFRFCIADTEHDWREGTEQYKFIEHCLATVDRQKQPWLIFATHRVLGYSSGSYYAQEGFEEPMGRESLQKLWQKYRVDIAFYGHVHNYERTCPIYQNQCVSNEKSHYTGTMNGTIHVVVGGGGSHLSAFTELQTPWSLYRDFNFGFGKLTAFNHSSLLFEYKRSDDGKVYDSFTISRDYRDVLACVHDSCSPTTLAT